MSDALDMFKKELPFMKNNDWQAVYTLFDGQSNFQDLLQFGRIEQHTKYDDFQKLVYQCMLRQGIEFDQSTLHRLQEDNEEKKDE